MPPKDERLLSLTASLLGQRLIVQRLYATMAARNERYEACRRDLKDSQQRREQPAWSAHQAS